MFEPSYGVLGMSMQQAQRVCTKYNQETVIYMGSEPDAMVGLVHEGNMLEPLGKFAPSKFASAYSEIRGRPFVCAKNGPARALARPAVG